MKFYQGSALAISLVLLGCSQTPYQHAVASTQHAAAASGHAASAVGHGAVASGQVVGGAVALPLKAVGAVGEAADKAGDALLNSAGVSKPLPVSDDTVSAGPAPKTE
ncbi:hypothetical protein NOX82_27530 [Pseudomonas citronellolis]|uniref:hypothetical protein n=1 Tax=Pseudomonas citronellolis TaxID=53408 RepID=UPI002111E979|nr:hypothetical protein [Pseudomonas citronellolis]UUC49582.1 hypothetical protein NOX82_27530 [Pseudomonas citronellolis]